MSINHLSQEPSGSLTADQFFDGLIAAVRATGATRLTGGQPLLHRAFQDVIKHVGKSSDLKVDLVNVDYDPLYGLSGWFDRSLTRAQRDLLISFPNPSYDVIEIGISREEADHILSNQGHKEVFLQLAKTFQNSMKEHA